MAQLGARIDTAHQILGLSTTDVQKYGFVAKATGTDSDTLVQTIGRLQQNLERAQSGIGPTALALQALGLSAKALAALPIDQQMLKLSDAFAKYADGGKKAALANELVRNGAQTLLPAFDKGSEGIKALTDAAVNAGTVMTSQTVTALAAVELKGITLKASLEALGGTLIADFDRPFHILRLADECRERHDGAGFDRPARHLRRKGHVGSVGTPRPGCGAGRNIGRRFLHQGALFRHCFRLQGGLGEHRGRQIQTTLRSSTRWSRMPRSPTRICCWRSPARETTGRRRLRRRSRTQRRSMRRCPLRQSKSSLPMKSMRNKPNG